MAKNPQDATLRNVRSAAKKIVKLQADVKELQKSHKVLWRLMFRLARRVK